MTTYDELMAEKATDEMMDILDEFFENAGQPAVFSKGLESKDPEKVISMFKFWFENNKEYLDE